jgi:hypothetical protein
MESGGMYDLMILSLSIISFYDIITGVDDDENGIGIIIKDRSINGGLFYESFDIHEYFLLYLLSLKFDILFDESREK